MQQSIISVGTMAQTLFIFLHRVELRNNHRWYCYRYLYYSLMVLSNRAVLLECMSHFYPFPVCPPCISTYQDPQVQYNNLLSAVTVE